MSTQTEAKAAEKQAAKASHDLTDDHSGVYGWFRRNQKKLLYTVGLFVLITFSVSGPMLATVSGLFGKDAEMSTIMVGKKRVSMTREDYQVGLMLASRPSVFVDVMPAILVGDGGRSELTDVYAWLRRAAITEGIEVSEVEVQRALEARLEGSALESVAQLAGQLGFASRADCEAQFAEAMRIGTLLRLQTLALDSSEASILADVIGDREKIAFRAATFDEKALDEQLKAAGGMSDDDLLAWLDTKEEFEKQRLGVFDQNRVALTIGALMFDEFDRAEWEEQLTGFEVGPEQRTKLYGIERERFKNEDETYKPADDETVVATLDKLILTEKVLQELHRKLVERRTEFTKEANDDRTRCQQEYFTAQNEVNELELKVNESPEDEALKEELRQKKEVLVAKENARKAADEAVDARYAAFDFAAAFVELTQTATEPKQGKKGVVQRSFTEPRKEAELKDLDAGDLGLGEWPTARNATFHQKKGDFSSVPQRTTKAAMIYMVNDIVVRPLKPREELLKLLEGAYYTEKAKEQGEAAKTKLEEALLRLAKAKMPDKVAEIEGARQSRIDAKLAEWEQSTKDEIAAAEIKLADTRPETQARAAWDETLRELRARLEAKDAKAEEVANEVDAAIETEIGDEAKKLHKEVLDEAAAEAGFTATDVGPLPRDVASRPRFDKGYDPTVVYLFRTYSELDEGEATGVVQDMTNRRWYAAVCKSVAPLTAADVTRREFEMARKGGFFQSFAAERAFTAYSQAFTKEALEQRYDVQSPAGKQTVDEPGK